MKLEFKIPNRFCPDHGTKMKHTGFDRFFNTNTGALETCYANYKCERWFCVRKGVETIVFGGKALEPKK